MQPIHWVLVVAGLLLFVGVRLVFLERARISGIQRWVDFHRFSFDRASDERIGPRRRGFRRLWTQAQCQTRNVVRGKAGRYAFTGFDFYDIDPAVGRSRTFSAVVVETGLRFPQLVIEKESLLDSVAKKFGMPDVELGDPEFDRRFLLSSDDPAWVVRLLQSDLRSLLVQTPVLQFGSRLKLLEFHEGSLIACGDQTGGFDARDYQAIVDFLAELLELLHASPACRR